MLLIEEICIFKKSNETFAVWYKLDFSTLFVFTIINMQFAWIDS